MTLNTDSIAGWGARLAETSARVNTGFPGEGPARQPVSTVYGGAQLFSATTPAKLGELARAFADRWTSTPGDLAATLGLHPVLADRVHPAVLEKLTREPVEDFRIDFEDGYGHRPDEEEDGHAVATAEQVAVGMESGSLPPFIGIRIKTSAPSCIAGRCAPSTCS